jgi:glycosyltransferase involved in cell wall biosynthesis
MRSLHDHRKPAVVIANGFVVGGAVERAVNLQPPIRFVFTGSGGLPWHGLDKIYELATLLDRDEFYIVGPSPLDGAPLPANVKFCGTMAPDELSKFYAGMDVGISTLALFRKGMDEACPLKSREYLAHGLPVVGCYYDPDMENQDFYLRIPNNEDAVRSSVSLIKSFALGWKARTVDLNVVRNVIGDGTKERKRLDFFRAVSGNR